MSTLSGNTIASSYPSLLRLDNFTGASTTYNVVVDGLGRQVPMFVATNKIKFNERLDFRDTTSLDFSGTSWNVDAASIDFTNANTNGIIKTAAVQKSTGRLSGLTQNISFSGGTGIDVEQDNTTGVFTFNNTSSDKQIVYKGSPGTTTTAGKPVYWKGGRWNNGPTSLNAYNKLIGISVGTNTFTDGVIVGGLIDDAGNTGFTEGALYLPNSSGPFDSVPDYTAGRAQRGIGHSLGSGGIILNPDIYYIINNNTSYIITNNDEVLITNDGFALSYE